MRAGGSKACRRVDEEGGAMMRSEINTVLQETAEFFAEYGFHLPPYAFWSVEDWAAKGPEVSEIVERRLGWDITDFGRGDFLHCGLSIFTLRNGSKAEMEARQGKLYCEKILMLEPDQVCPYHFHWVKMEDIINRGGGTLAIEVANSTPEGGLADTEVELSLDCTRRHFKPGHTIRLAPGESVTLPPGVYHRLHGVGARVMVGEVSLVNDDDHDNRFLEAVGRFPDIQEDVKPLHLLRGDYDKFWGGRR
jgi:D-lyxose ketol-isomerase